MAHLRIVSPDGSEGVLALGDKPVTAGRSEECELVLAEPKASRRHCTFKPVSGGWKVVDEASSNGTWMGDVCVLSARLKPGDEVEIGETVITFEAEEEAAPAPREPRRARAKSAKPSPWGVLAIPVVAWAVALFGASLLAKSETQAASASLAHAAKAEVDRAALIADPARRMAALTESRERFAGMADSVGALATIDAAISGGGIPQQTDAAAPQKDDWRGALASLDATPSVAPLERRAALRELLDRSIDDADAVAELRARLRMEMNSVGEQARADRERVFAEADRAAEEGRIGRAIELWIAWLRRTSVVNADDDRAVAGRLATLADTARSTAEQTAEQFEQLRRDGKPAEAATALDAAIERLRGTGYDDWLAVRGGHDLGSGHAGEKPGKAPDPVTTKERTLAERERAEADRLAKGRRFADAAKKLEEAAAQITTLELKADLKAVAADYTAESAFLAKLLAQVAENPAKFVLTLDGRTAKVVAANGEEVSIVGKDGRTEPHAITDLASAAIVQLVDSAKKERGDFVPAALLMDDLGEKQAYLKWMYKELATDVEDAKEPAKKQDAEAALKAASEVHARRANVPKPEGGYMPHPDPKNQSIVTYEEWKEITNAAAVAKLRVQLEAVVEQIEKSKQGRAIDAVRNAYVKLEAARAQALALIFDETKYFYPYLDRQREYAPVQHVVDELVKAVRTAWADPTKANVKTDEALEKQFVAATHFETEIDYLIPSHPSKAADLMQRVNNVRMYLGRGDLTVQNFFENDVDLELAAYNAKVLKYDQTVRGDVSPTDTERTQVRITNEYRMMFGHRRALRIHPLLVKSSRGHSTDMSTLGFFDHFNKITPGKRTPEDRIKLAGYEPSGYSENIAEGSSDPAAAHDRWIHSSGHHRNLLMKGWVEMGSGQCGAFWTQNFGFRLDDDWEGGVPKETDDKR